MTNIQQPSKVEESHAEVKGHVEFLISGDIDVEPEEWDRVMTPKSFEWSKSERKDWTYYEVGDNEFSYSMEPPGIHMIFMRAVSYEMAHAIALDIVSNLKTEGFQVELIEMRPH